MSIKGWRALLLAAVAGAAMWAGLVWAVSLALSDDSPRTSYVDVQDGVVVSGCPTEDSCTVDYRDGSWHITEVTP